MDSVDIQAAYEFFYSNYWREFFDNLGIKISPSTFNVAVTFLSLWILKGAAKPER